MTTWNNSQYRPEYPKYRTRAVPGLMKPSPFGPPDMRPGGFGPGYSVYGQVYGRHLAGVDSMNADKIKDYPNELQLLSEADDVVSNGVFDPNLSHGNIHPDYGVFQDHQSLPGYLARDQFYSPSEVTDLTTGKPVNYVPGGAVSFQQGQKETFDQNQALYELPPGISPYTPSMVDDMSTASHPPEYSQAISPGIGEDVPDKPAPNYALYGGVMLAGLVVGVGVAYALKGKR